MCDCYSYNKEVGSVPEVILDHAQYFPGTRETVCVDACIVNVIKHLWRNKVETLGCCCGHNTESPSIVLSQNITKEAADKVRLLITEVDSRHFRLFSWSFMELFEE